MRPHRPPLVCLLVLLLALGLAACGGEPAEREPEAAEEGGEKPVGHEPPDATVPDSASVVLSREGLGVVRFGEEAEAALTKLREAMGKPNIQSKWLPMERSLWGACPGSEVRGAKWGDLWVLFSDRSELSDKPHLSGWLLGGTTVTGRTELETDEDIGLGSTGAELREAYGDRLSMESADLGTRFSVEPAEGEKAGSRLLVGTISGQEDDDTVNTLRGGLPCTA